MPGLSKSISYFGVGAQQRLICGWMKSFSEVLYAGHEHKTRAEGVDNKKSYDEHVSTERRRVVQYEQELVYGTAAYGSCTCHGLPLMSKSSVCMQLTGKKKWLSRTSIEKPSPVRLFDSDVARNGGAG